MTVFFPGGVAFPVGYKKWLRAQQIAETNRLLGSQGRVKHELIFLYTHLTWTIFANSIQHQLGVKRHEKNISDIVRSEALCLSH